MHFKFSAALVATVLLTACTSPSSEYDNRPGFVSVPVPQPTAGTQLGYLSVHVSGYNESGTNTLARVRIGPGGQGNPSRKSTIINADPQLASRVAVSLRDGQDKAAALGLAKQIARATYCRSGPITENTGIRRYTKPEDLNAILAESTRQGRDVIPAGIKGQPVSATRFSRDGTPEWFVSLKCNAPYPY